MNEQIKALLASYGRSVLSAGTALYLAGVTDPVDLTWSLVAAIIPVALRAVNPNDKAFGIVPKAEEVEEALSKATPKRAPESLRKTVGKVSKAEEPVVKKITKK
jgi:hypothetical protein